MSHFQGIAKNTLVQILGRASVILITLITTSLLTRILGPDGYGNYVYILALIMLFVSVSDWGTGMISVREAAQKSHQEEKIFGNVLIFRCLSALVCFLIVNFLVKTVPEFKLLSMPITIASFLILFLSIRTSFNIVFQTKLRFENQVMVEIFSSGLFLTLFLILGRFSLNLETVFVCLTASSLIACFLALFLAAKLTTFDFHPDAKVFNKIFWEALPTGALLLLFSIYNRIDILILGNLKGATPVGIYGLAYKVHDNLILIAAYLMNSLFPLLSQYQKSVESDEKLVIIYKRTFDILALFGLGCIVSIYFFAPLIINLVGGEQFASSVPVLKVLVFATFFAYLNHLTGYTLIALGKQKISLVIALVTLFGNVLLNLWLIPLYSYFGAAYVTIATEAFVFILTSYFLKKIFNLKISLNPFSTLIQLIKTRGKIY
jgi:O-antigen/teichoic acid export membrane protein